MARLAVLSRILLRIAVLPQAKETIAYSLPAVTERLASLSPSSRSSTSSLVVTSAHEQETVEDLFRAGLAMGGEEPPTQRYGMDVDRTRKGIVEVHERVKRLAGPVGEWVRREVRIAGWEAVQGQ